MKNTKKRYKKMKVDRKELLQLLKDVAIATATNNLPICQFFHFYNGDVEAFNLDLHTKAVLPPAIAGIEGSVEAKTLLRSLRLMTDKHISISVSNDNLLLVGSNTKFSLPLTNMLSEKIEFVGNDIVAGEISDSTWEKLVRATRFVRDYASMGRPIKNVCVYGKKKAIASTDGACLYRATIEELSFENDILIPPETINKLAKWTEYPNKMGVNKDYTLILFEQSDKHLRCVCRLVEGKFPNIDTAIPPEEEDDVKVSFPNADKIMKRLLSVFFFKEDSLNDDDGKINIVVKNGRVILKAEGRFGSIIESFNADLDSTVKYKGLFHYDILEKAVSFGQPLFFKREITPSYVKGDDFIFAFMPMKKE